jgi:hypothetical protein
LFRETQLSRRVTEWTLKLEPILQAQEESAPFDIHVYSNKVLQKVDSALVQHSISQDKRKNFKAEQQQVSFSDVVQGSSSAEVCRVFLACLQLANLGNVVIGSNITDQGEIVRNDFDVCLVTTTQQQDIQGFLAPSIHGSENLSNPPPATLSSAKNKKKSRVDRRKQVNKLLSI